MKAWIIEPRDSLIVRDGRPFGLGAGMHATSLDFPFPSTTTGGARTRAGLDQAGIFDTGLITEVKNISVKGPLLVELDMDGKISDWLMPTPSDSLLISDEIDKNKVHIKRLGPLDVSPQLTNLNEGNGDLLPVGFDKPLKGKPLGDAPRYWSWKKKFKDWLAEPRDASTELDKLEGALGHRGPEKDSRVHASINDSFTTGETGENNLFQTRGLEFRRILAGEKLKDTKRLALVVFVDDNAQGKVIKEGFAPLGGERRLVMWREAANDETKEIRQCPEDIRKVITETGRCRLVLLTPAFFKGGSYPEKLLQTESSITPKLRAIAHNRYQVVSGWDFVTDKPKPTRRLVPSGSVLFLELDGDQKHRGAWIERMWFSCVSDDDARGEQDFCKDGFGLTVLGTWDGKLLNL